MRIVVAESTGFSPDARACLEALGAVDLQDLAPEDFVEGCRGAEAVMIRLRNRVDADFFASHSTLKAVVSPTTGLDHVDLDAADRAGVAVLSLRGEVDFLRTVTATAEHTWGLLLALVRRIPAAAAHVERGGWDRDAFRGRELKGRRLGVLGMGRLGGMVADYGRAFGMRVAAHDPHLADWPAGVERKDSATDLARGSDVLCIHLPLDETTRLLVGTEVLGALPEGAVLVNTSRGGVVDEDALLAALQEGRVGGAALDVLHGETEPGGLAGGLDGGLAGHPLVARAREHGDVLITPHLGGATLESMHHTEIFMAEKLSRWLAGGPVRVDAGPTGAPR